MLQELLLGHMASTATVTWIASYETASALASRSSPEVGMATRHVPGLSYPVLPPHLQPVAGSCFSSGRSYPSASVQAFFLCVNTGWGAICNGHAAAGLWTGPSSLKVFYCRISAGDCWSVKCVLSKNVKTCEHHSCFLTFLTGYLLTLGLHFT